LLLALCLTGAAHAQNSELQIIETLRKNAAGIQEGVPSPVISNTAPRLPVPPAGSVQPGLPAETPAAAARPALPPAPRGEFQELVRLSVGRDLPLFGYSLFRDPSTTFAPLDAVPVPADYVIGPGDELYIRAWGQVEIDYRAIVDRDGTIYVPKVGSIGVVGVRYANLEERVRSAVRRVFKNFELIVTLGQLRAIQVFVVGHVRQPGSYTVSALSTLVNALFASGGPSEQGSMRRVQLKRGSQLVTEFDVYDLLLKGDKSRDAQLLPGDVIFVPPVGPRAAIAGSVNVPAIYELNGGLTLAGALEMAGGLTPAASGEMVTVERIVERKARIVRELRLDESGLRQVLSDGDLVTVYTLSPRIENAVTLRGNVAQPMRTAWRQRMRVSDLIPERDALIVPDYWLDRNEQGQMRSWLRGGEAERGRDPMLDQAKLRGELKRVSNEINWDYAVIERLSQENLSTTLVPFNLGRAINEPRSDHDPVLLPGDVVTVFSKDDIRVPAASQTKYVRLEGEFHAAGVYQVDPGETLRAVVQRAGGLTQNAYVYGAEFTRESTRLQQQKQLEDALTRLEQEAQRVALARSQAVIAVEEAQALSAQSAATNALIAKLRAVKATGRIVLDLPGEKATDQDLPDLVLEDGDRLYVPPQPSTVSVFGAVYNPNAYVHRSGRKAADYLEQAGGPTRDADKRSIYLVRADGTVVSSRQKGWLSGVGNEGIYRGDALVVPESFERFNFTKELKDWTQILYQLALGVAGLKVLGDL
jgi:protein involved in polysaccharide export with SLBB domain